MHWRQAQGIFSYLLVEIVGVDIGGIVHRDPLNHAPFPIQLCINDIGTHGNLNINYLTVVGSGIDIATTTSSSVYRNMVNSVESHLRCGILWRTGRCCYSTDHYHWALFNLAEFTWQCCSKSSNPPNFATIQQITFFPILMNSFNRGTFSIWVYFFHMGILFVLGYFLLGNGFAWSME